VRIGIFSLQGAVEPHREKLRAIGAEGVLVRTAQELVECHGLIVPGGESTTVLKLIADYGLKQPLLDFAREKPIWGVCAGSILMAARVEAPPQESLRLIPITVKRNAYGRQNESFITELELRLPGQPAVLQECVFIRAPQIVAWSDDVTVLAEFDGKPVALQSGHHLTTTFHPELSQPEWLHRHFLSLCGAAASQASA
jgi:5'-phosphate synthase pdxT subunit